MHERILELSDVLAALPVKAVFGIPGSGLSLQLITALERHGVPFYGACHEGSAAVMAGAFGRQTGTLGCSLSIKGPGLANMLSGILTNYYEQLPTLSIAESLGPSAPLSRMHKRLDHEAATAFCTKAYATLGDPRTTVARLAAHAWEEIPGSVHLDLCPDDTPRFVSHVEASPGAPRRDGWSGARRLVEYAVRPVVIVGGLARRRRWSQRLADLHVPVFTTLLAKGVLDETLPWAAGVFTGDGKALSPEARILPEADLVVGLGLRNTEVLTARPWGCPLVIMDVIGGHTAEGFEAAHVIVTQADEIERILDMLSENTWGRDLIAESRVSLERHLLRDEWSPGTLFMQLERLLPTITYFVTDTGFFCTVAEHLWRARSSTAFFASANGRSMGNGLPTAIGVALANRTRPTVCALGDGGAQMYVGDLKLAVSERLPILFILLTDGRYGSVAGVPAAQGLSPHATTVLRPSWFKAVNALDCPAVQVHAIDQFVSAVNTWEWRNGPKYIEAVFDPERYAKIVEGVR